MKTLSDIAKELGVSSATVSYVYNNKWKENRISEKLAQKIKEKLKEEKVYPDLLGTQLKTKRTHSIGVILSDLERNYNLRLLKGIEQEIANSGNIIILGNSHYGEMEKYFLDVMVRRKVDGLIINPLKPKVVKEYIKEFESLNIPVVFIDNYVKGCNIPSVVSNNFSGAKQLTQYCIQNGRRRIIFIGGSSSLEVVKDRYNGYCKALEEANLKAPNIHFPDKRGPSSYSLSLLEQMLEKIKPDALVISSFIYFYNGFKLIKNKGIKVPDDILLTGFDFPEDIVIEKGYIIDNIPPLVVFIQDAEGIGRESARLLIEMINNKGKINSQNQIMLKGGMRVWK